MVLFSQRTVHEPSVLLSQKQEDAVCRPAPFFCMIVHVTENYNTFVKLNNVITTYENIELCLPIINGAAQFGSVTIRVANFFWKVQIYDLVFSFKYLK